MLDIAEIVGRTLLEVSVAIGDKMSKSSRAPSATILLGGQRKDGEMRLFLIYPEGNFIEATEDTPYLQIGAAQVRQTDPRPGQTRETSLEEGRKVVLLSMDLTIRSNLSVGMPLDLCMVPMDECKVTSRERIEVGDPEFTAMSEAWSKSCVRLRQPAGGLKSGYLATATICERLHNNS